MYILSEYEFNQIWFKDISVSTQEEQKKDDQDTNRKDQKVEFLYFELLKLVDAEAQNQLNELDKNINVLGDEYKDDWNKLVVWDAPDSHEKVRQDVITNGIVSQYTYNQLTESSGSVFNSPNFYG